MTASARPCDTRIASEVTQFSAVFSFTRFRHPGLDPGSIDAVSAEWTPDQVRGGDGVSVASNTPIAREVAQISGPPA